MPAPLPLLSSLSTPWLTIGIENFRLSCFSTAYSPRTVDTTRSSTVCNGSNKIYGVGSNTLSTSVVIFEACVTPSSIANHRWYNAALFPANHVLQILYLLFSSVTAVGFTFWALGRSQKSSERVTTGTGTIPRYLTAATVKKTLAR